MTGAMSSAQMAEKVNPCIEVTLADGTNDGVRKAGEFEKKKAGERRQTKVKVVVRVRPPLSNGSKTCVETDGNKVLIFNHRNVQESLQYEFSSVYDRNSSQREIFENCVHPLLGHALNGENVSIFAYGPTGTGKTYTMLGTEDDPGMIPRVIHILFQTLVTKASTTDATPRHKVTFSFLEICNEKVQDLLNLSETDLPIREDGNHNIFVAGLTEKVISNFSDFKTLFGPASNNRTVAATKLNDQSSRSHCIVQLKVDSWSNGQVYHGKICLIDLAGSEDNRRTGNRGLRLKESGAINKSLFVLGEVVDAINNNLPRIPYRNSKLTRLLQDSIGGSCHSVMITNVAPEETFYYNTYCTLNFATKSRKIVNNSTASVSFDRSTEACRLLKRSHSDTQVQKADRVKQLRLSSSESILPALTAAIPLDQKQKHLEKTVRCCMRKMEDLAHQLHLMSSSSSQNAAVQEDLTMVQIQRQLSEMQAQLQTLQQQNVLKQRLTEDKQQQQSVGSILAPVPCADRTLKDKTNMRDRLPAAGQLYSLIGGEPSCSPLFLSSATSQQFPKDKSTAIKSTVAAVTARKFKADVAKFSSEQKQQNEEFLCILNTASVRRLQQLHTVGAKRARMIYDWRQAHGDFTSLEDLKEIPGFSEKYISSLLKRNFILADV